MTTITREPQEGKRRHKLMPKEIRDKLPKLGAQDGKGGEAMVYLKLFTPMGRMTLYVTEFDGEDTLFGFMVSPLGADCDEWGYASFRELAEVNRFGMPAVERDCYWAERRVEDIPEIP